MALFLMTLLLLLVGCATFPTAPLNMSKLTVYERMVNSVVVLPGCTGLVLKNDKGDVVVLTAAHCVRHHRIEPKAVPATIPAVVPQETYRPILITAELVKGKEMPSCFGIVGSVSNSRDLAIIRATKCKLPTAVAVLAQRQPRWGDTIYAVGHPLSSSYVLTKGIVSRPLTMYGDDNYLLLSAPVVFGNSGGPCFNAKGEVIGLVTGVGAVRIKMVDGRSVPLWAPVTHLGLAVPLDDIRQFLKVGGFPELAK
jgi:hypothetical protein